MYTFTTQINQQEHNAFVTGNKYCNLLQSAQWAKIKDNWKSLLAGVRNEEGALVASSLVLIKPLPLGFTMLYIPRGPILDYENKELIKFYFDNLKKVAKKHHCLFIKLDPGIHVNDYKIQDQNDHKYPETAQYLKNLEEAGLRHQGFVMNIAESIQPRFQANVYKDDNLEENLPRHTKRLMKDATKRNVQVKITGKEGVDAFSKVVALTEERKNVALRNQEYFELLMDTYGEDAKIFLAEVDIPTSLQEMKEKQAANEKEIAECPENAKKKLRRLMDIKTSLEKDIKEFEGFAKEYPTKTVIAGILSIKYGDTMEMLYAGMNDKFKKFMPQYYLYVQNFKWAFEHGCNFSNMGGVEGDLQDGLTKFKSNFDPYINEFIGEFDYPVNKLLYRASEMAYKIRKKKNKKK